MSFFLWRIFAKAVKNGSKQKTLSRNVWANFAVTKAITVSLLFFVEVLAHHKCNFFKKQNMLSTWLLR